MPTAFVPCGCPTIRCKAQTVPGMPWCKLHAPKREGKKITETDAEGHKRMRTLPMTDEEWEATVRGYWTRSAERS